MKAIQIHAYGPSDLIHVENAPKPSPKAGEILVKIRAAGVNPVDWKIREGFLKDVAPKSFPLTLGQDFSGEVVEVGSGVTRFKAGDAVFGFSRGSYAEFAAVPATLIARKPATIDYNAAATLPTPALTAYQILKNVIKPEAGQRILIQGAAGGVGSIATQLVLSTGARVIAVASNKDAAFLTGLGVDEVIDFRTERFEEKVKELDAVIDLVGGEVLLRSLPVIKAGGVVVTTVGPPVEAQAAKRRVRVVHFRMSPNAADLAEIANLVDRGVLKTRLAQVFSLTQAREALDLNQSGRASGKVILKVA